LLPSTTERLVVPFSRNKLAILILALSIASYLSGRISVLAPRVAVLDLSSASVASLAVMLTAARAALPPQKHALAML
jgi:hypothetical protein